MVVQNAVAYIEQNKQDDKNSCHSYAIFILSHLRNYSSHGEWEIKNPPCVWFRNWETCSLQMTFSNWYGKPKPQEMKCHTPGIYDYFAETRKTALKNQSERKTTEKITRNTAWSKLYIYSSVFRKMLSLLLDVRLKSRQGFQWRSEAQ